MKSFSSRVKNKNFRKLKDKPLWRWTVDTVIESKLFDTIFLSTDNLDLVKDFNYISVKKIKRPKELCQPNIHAIDVVFNILNQLDNISDNDNIFLLLPTSPFRSVASLKKTYKLLENNAKSVIAIARASKGSNSYRTLKKNTNIINLNPDINLHRQSSDYEEYVVTGSLFASKYKSLCLHRSFHQEEGIGIIVSEFEAIDINTELDLLTASVYAKEKL